MVRKAGLPPLSSRPFFHFAVKELSITDQRTFWRVNTAPAESKIELNAKLQDAWITRGGDRAKTRSSKNCGRCSERRGVGEIKNFQPQFEVSGLAKWYALDDRQIEVAIVRTANRIA